VNPNTNAARSSERSAPVRAFQTPPSGRAAIDLYERASILDKRHTPFNGKRLTRAYGGYQLRDEPGLNSRIGSIR
jgi:hypothetical protein